jgi:hypothetical protein
MRNRRHNTNGPHVTTPIGHLPNRGRYCGVAVSSWFDEYVQYVGSGCRFRVSTSQSKLNLLNVNLAKFACIEKFNENSDQNVAKSSHIATYLKIH